MIPTLLLRGGGLVKTVNFKGPRYVGDAINTVRIFNDKEVDELTLLDIDATSSGRGPDVERIADIVSEAFMPVCYGGGVRTVDEVWRLLAVGVEKVAIGTAATDPQLIVDAAAEVGSQSIVVCVDVRRRRRRQEVRVRNGSQVVSDDPVAFARSAQDCGAGEILLTSIDRDGSRRGYDLELIRTVASSLDIPVVACGGAGTVQHLGEALSAGAAGAAAGSMFIFHGKHQAVLISYPAPAERRSLGQSAR